MTRGVWFSLRCQASVAVIFPIAAKFSQADPFASVRGNSFSTVVGPPCRAQQKKLRFARSMRNQMEMRVYGPHFLQETAPHATGRALAEWIAKL